MSRKKNTIKEKCVFCGEPTNYYRIGIGYICAKCLGEYEGAYWKELWKRNYKEEEQNPVSPWQTYWPADSTMYPYVVEEVYYIKC